MIRYNVHLTEEQVKELQALAKKTGLLVSETIRRAVDEYLDHQQERQQKRQPTQTQPE